MIVYILEFWCVCFVLGVCVCVCLTVLYVLAAYMCVPYAYLMPTEARRDSQMTWDWSYRQLQLLCSCRESNLGSLQKHQEVLITSGRSLQTQWKVDEPKHSSFGREQNVCSERYRTHQKFRERWFVATKPDKAFCKKGCIYTKFQ